MKTVGAVSDVMVLNRVFPDVSLKKYETLIEGRTFTRWYRKNKRVVHTLAIAVPAFALRLFGVDLSLVNFLIPSEAIPAVAGGGSFTGTHGVILLHMLVIGFLTLVVTTFLKFTGRGDLVPLIAFVGGGAILYEVIGMFKDIYQAVVGFLKL